MNKGLELFVETFSVVGGITAALALVVFIYMVCYLFLNTLADRFASRHKISELKQHNRDLRLQLQETRGALDHARSQIDAARTQLDDIRTRVQTMRQQKGGAES